MPNKTLNTNEIRLGYEFSIEAEQGKRGVMRDKETVRARDRFSIVPLSDIPHNRNSRHSRIVAEILTQLKTLDANSAIKIPLAEVGEHKANLRSALHRAARNARIDLMTASDDKHLYVFRQRSSLR
jgi:hypothetical protein